MYEIYLDEYQGSEQELKEKVYSTLKSLNICEPEEWSVELVEYANPGKSSSEVIEELSKLPQFLTIKPLFEEWTIEKILNYIFLVIDVELEKKYLISFLLSHLYKVNRKFFLMLRYSWVTTILSDKLGQQTTADNPSVIMQLIVDGLYENDKILLSYIAEEGAKEEIDCFNSDENNQHYIQEITNVEESIDSYIKEYIYRLCNGIFFQLTSEAILKNFESSHFKTISEDPINKDVQKEVVKYILDMSQRSLKTRLEIKDERGGSRKRKGFTWDDEKKVEFYRAVESLPKIKSKLLWHHAFEKLNEEDFNYKYIDYLKTETAFKNVPEQLFRQAVRTWQKYKDSFINPTAEEKPFAFALKHALHLLGYSETKYSTMKKYYGEGKKLCKISNLD